MKRQIIGLMAVGYALAAISTIGAPVQAAAKHAAAKGMKCPYCGMIMTAKKTAKMPVAVHLPTGKTVFCCTSCHKAPAAKPKSM